MVITLNRFLRSSTLVPGYRRSGFEIHSRKTIVKPVPEYYVAKTPAINQTVFHGRGGFEGANGVPREHMPLNEIPKKAIHRFYRPTREKPSPQW